MPQLELELQGDLMEIEGIVSAFSPQARSVVEPMISGVRAFVAGEPTLQAVDQSCS